MSEQAIEYIKELKQQLKSEQETNYVKFASGDKKILIFKADPQYIYPTQNEMNGKMVKRMRFVVVDVTDPMKPRENQLWDISNRWATTVLNYLERGQDCLEIERTGTGLTDTQYMVVPASRE